MGSCVSQQVSLVKGFPPPDQRPDQPPPQFREPSWHARGDSRTGCAPAAGVIAPESASRSAREHVPAGPQFVAFDVDVTEMWVNCNSDAAPKQGAQPRM